MLAYVIHRLAQAALVMVLISAIVFVAMHFLPGDPIYLVIDQQQASQASPEYIQKVRHQAGLDRPIIVQYLDWLGNMARGNLGTSITKSEPVINELRRRLPITLNLAIPAIVLSVVIGVPAGVITALKRGRWVDTVLTVLANIGITMPIFWLGLLLIYVVGLKLRWLPIYGYTSPLDDFAKSTRQIIMPVICLSLFAMASNVRQVRSSMLEVLGQDYIRTASSKGLSEAVVVARHALKNAFIPVVTLIGISFKNILGGSVLVESVFNIPGLGRLGVDAVVTRDYPTVQAFVMYIAAIVVLANLAVDLSYGWLDPRIRLAG